MSNLYLEELKRGVGRPEDKDLKSYQYEEVLDVLHSIYFEWSIKNDDNRNADGLDLREYIAINNQDVKAYVPVRGSKATVLEVLMALSSRMSDIINNVETPQELFWGMLDRLGIYDARWHLWGDNEEPVHRNYLIDIINKWMNRDYHYSGRGGIFPLTRGDEDQRKVEIWYQMYAYISENYDV